MKEFHIINVGNSLLGNFKRVKKEIQNISEAEQEKWKKLLDDIAFMQEIYNFLKDNPKNNCAEMNTFLRKVENRNPSKISVYLTGTKTYSNEICIRTIQRFLKECKYQIFSPAEISGYFWEEKFYDYQFAKREFIRDINQLLDRLLYLIKKKKEEGYRVLINPTGGLKAHVITFALAGFLTNCEVYYMHEEFKDVVTMPGLFYLPKGREIKLLEILSDKLPRSAQEFDKLSKDFENEIKRLEIYGLVEIEKEETGKGYRIRITNRGLTYLQLLKSNI